MFVLGEPSVCSERPCFHQLCEDQLPPENRDESLMIPEEQSASVTGNAAETSGGSKTPRIKLTECEHMTAVWTNGGGRDEEENKGGRRRFYLKKTSASEKSLTAAFVSQSCETWFIFLFKTEERV